MDFDKHFFEEYLQYYAEYKKAGQLPGIQSNADEENCENDNDLYEKVKEEYDRLRTELEEAFSDEYDGGDTVVVDDAYVIYSISETAQLDTIVSALCQYAGELSDRWSGDDLYDFLRDKIHNNKLPCSFGGYEPACIVLALASIMGKLSCVEIKFLHDKWEERGDTGEDDYESHVIMCCKRNAAKVYVDHHDGVYEDEDEDEEEYEDEDEYEDDVEKEITPKTVFSFDFDKRRDGTSWMKKYKNYLTVSPRIVMQNAKFVFSGFADDNDCVVNAVAESGGLVRSSVSGVTDYLVVNPRYAGEKKVNDAIRQQQNGKMIQIILINDLLDWFLNESMETESFDEEDVPENDDSLPSNINDIFSMLDNLLELGDTIDGTDVAGVKALTNGESTTREAVRLELGIFLLYVANGSGTLSRSDVTMINYAFGGEYTKSQLKEIADSMDTPSPANSLTLLGFLYGDKALNQQNGTNKTALADLLISLYETFGKVIVLLNENPVSEERLSSFIAGMKACAEAFIN